MRFPNLRCQLLGLGLALGLVGACADEKPELEVTRLMTTPDAALPVVVDAPLAKSDTRPSVTNLVDGGVAIVPVTKKPIVAEAKPTPTSPAPVAAKAAPASAPVDREQQARDHIEAAREAIAENDVDSARQHAQLAVALSPLSSSAWNTLGRVDMLSGDPDGAAAAFTNATTTNPENLYAWNNLGLVEMRRGHWDAAITALEQATTSPTLSDRIPQAYMFNNLGAAYEHVGRAVDARAAYRKAAERGSLTAKASLARLDDHNSAKADLDLKSWEDVGPAADIH